MHSYKRMISLVVLILAVFQLAEAQNRDERYLSSTDHTVRSLQYLEKGTSLERALDTIEREYEVIFLYKSGLLDGKVLSERKRLDLQGNLYDTLNDVLEDFHLAYNKLTHRTLGIFPARNNIVQQHKVSGTVTDAVSGETLPGVNVIIKGTSTGTSTGLDGNYELVVSSLQDTLIFSFVGFESKEVPIDGRASLDVELTPQTISGDEVIVIGFGEQEKVSVTGSISTVSTEEIQRVPVPSVSNALGGKLPGIVTRQSHGEPGYDAAQVYIRGLATWGNRNPLILVDGIERDLNNINAEVIESISVLKDASATAVYGVRGANGVILIKTKRGRQGSPQVTFRTEAAVRTPLRIPEYVNGAEYATLMNEALTNVGKPLQYTEEEIEKYRTGSDPYLYPNVDWNDVIFKDNTHQTINNLSISGGGDIARYYVNVGYTWQDGVYKNDQLNNYNANIDLKRYNFRSNVDVSLSENFEVHLGLGGIIRRGNYPGNTMGAIFDAIKKTPPHAFPVKNPDGSPGGVNLGFLGLNPWAMITQSGYDVWNQSTLQGTFGTQWDLSDLVTEGLFFNAKFAYDNYYNAYNQRHKLYEIRQYLGVDPVTGEDMYITHREGQPLGYGWSNSSNRAMYLEASVRYDQSFGKHGFGGLILFNRRDYVDITAGNSIANLPYRREGLAGRLTYEFDNRYLVEFNVGYNGSENFPRDKRYGLFPSVSGGWIISNERFWNVDFISHLKFRGSYGQVGNDQIGGRRFLYVTTIDENGAGQHYRFGETPRFYQGFSEGQIGNPDVTWEVSTKTNVGLDLELFDSKVKLQADAFTETRDGILMQRRDVPIISGFFPWIIPYANIGIVENKGVDGLLEIQNTTPGGFFYTLRGNFTFARNKIIENDEPQRRYPYLKEEGHPIDQPFGYVAIGFFEDEEDIANSPEQTFMSQVRPGDIKYKDLNGDGVIDTYDRQPIGLPRTPEIMYGFGGTVGYKGFDLSVHFAGVARTSLFLDFGTMFPFADGLGSWNVMREYYDNRWTPENPNPKYPAVIDGTSPNNYRTSTLYMHDGSYLRLKNAEIGYNLPHHVTQKLSIRGLRVFVNGLNLYTWDKVGVIDPESNHGTGQYPLQRSINGGVEIKF